MPNIRETAMTVEQLADILPLVLNPQHIMELFGLSKQTAYDLWEQPDFPGFRVGVKKLILRDNLFRFMKITGTAEAQTA